MIFFSTYREVSFNVRRQSTTALRFFMRFIRLVLYICDRNRIIRSNPSTIVKSVRRAFNYLSRSSMYVVFLMTRTLLPFLMFTRTRLFRRPQPRLLTNHRVTSVSFSVVGRTRLPASFSFIAALSHLRSRDQFFIPDN